MKYLVSIFFLLFTFVGMAQEDEKKPTIEKPRFKIIKDTVILDGKRTVMTDTIYLDTQNEIKRSADEVLPQLDSLKTAPENNPLQKVNESYVLLDNQMAAEIDSLWLRELGGEELFDTIHKEISELKYEPVVYQELPTDTLKARLARLNAKTPFNIEYNPSLESVIRRFLKRRKKSMERLMKISQYYFPMFEQELANHNIPLEVKYLAIVESALNPRARSRVGATGLWQFMYQTGKMYDLNVSSYVDDRQDPEKSTVAACKYLASLYKIFGDWDLALAAYNSGPGNVSKAIRRSGGYENYWNIRPNLPRETAGYLPAFLATMYIFEYAEEHGFQVDKIEVPHFATDTIRVKQLLTFDQISEVLNVKVEDIQFFNPAYKLDIIPHIKGRDYTLRLPVQEVGKFVNNEEAIYALAKEELAKREKPLPQLFEMDKRTRYRVQKGDYLGKIARRFGVRVSDIKRWNGLRSNRLRIGQRLTIYPKKPGFAIKKPSQKEKNTNNAKTYTVKSGDSLWSIAQKFPGVSVKNIQKWNDIRGNKLKPGMKLKVSK
ncbi:membrane-bound lytic murein transglycosylase D [Kordia periserrulae]|uniref:Membrane-bound lytic murein transglycosylase D n=1 Tax=Kordia periserrulae TaxID=701523 RepID=A0A2T6BWL1_9FLAO|nr:LysM peptidoglycan-binding domain-containing protein [Kordia periserrulae]PTX60460.1 membrane-bound lytic murein transglycosylase D [Kordia periserrulae]